MSSSEASAPAHRGLTVRARLTLWNCGLLAVALIALAAVLHWIARTVVMESVDRELISRANLVKESWVSRMDESITNASPPAAIPRTSQLVLSESATTQNVVPAVVAIDQLPAVPHFTFRPFNRFT